MQSSGPPPPPPSSSRSRVHLSAAPPATAPPEPGGRAELERSLRFLQAQHAETLRQLHAEIETLRRQNRDLHYRLIMYPMLQRTEFSPSASPAKSTPRRLSLDGKGSRGSPRPGWGEQSQGALWVDLEEPLVVLGSLEGEEEEEEEAQEGPEEPPRAAPRKAAAAAAEGPPSPESQEPSAFEAEAREAEPRAKPPSGVGLPKVGPQRHPGAREFCDRATSPILFPSISHERGCREPPAIPPASSNPFLANVLPSNMRKPPTLEECEVVIRQLWNINHMQMQELMYLRSCLEDIHKTRRIPEDYKLAGQLGSQESPHLPRMKNPSKTCRILTPLPAAERAVLPALKQTLGNAFAERQKRTQAVQRKRLHRTGL